MSMPTRKPLLWHFTYIDVSSFYSYMNNVCKDGSYTIFWKWITFDRLLYFDPLLIWTLLPNLTFYLIVWGFHRKFAMGAACQQTLTPGPVPL